MKYTVLGTLGRIGQCLAPWQTPPADQRSVSWWYRGLHTAGALLFAAFCALSGETLAAGFAIVEQSVKGLGSAFSSGAAADDASTIFFNPAGMTRLRGTQVVLAGHVIAPNAEFEDAGSSLNPRFGIAALTGGSGGDSGIDSLAPNLYVHRALSERLHIGLGINSPFALKTSYEDGWIGRYHALTSSILTVNINPSVALKLSDRLSLGAGLNIQRAEARLSNAVDQSGACLGLAAGGAPVNCGPGGLSLFTPGSTATDGNLDLRNARDLSVGWNLGVLFQPVKSTRIGLHYRSKISHNLEGTAVFNRINPGLAAVSAVVPGVTSLATQRASAKLTVPESASANIYHQVNDQWAVTGDVTWTRWTRFQNISVNFADGTQSVQPEDWDNSFRYSAGVSYRHSPKLTLRAGGAFDETPIPSAAKRTPRLPDADRIWLTAGASYRHSDTLSVDVGYAHLFVDTPKIANVAETSTGHVLNGEYDAKVDIISAQLVFQFE